MYDTNRLSPGTRVIGETNDQAARISTPGAVKSGCTNVKIIPEAIINLIRVIIRIIYVCICITQSVLSIFINNGNTFKILNEIGFGPLDEKLTT